MEDEKRPSLLGLFGFAASLIAFALLRSKFESASPRPVSPSPRPLNTAEPAECSTIQVAAPPPMVPPVNPVPGTPSGKKVLEWTAMLTSIGLLVVNVGLWKATKKSADAAKTAADTASGQFKLTKQQLEYTQSANLRVGISVGFPPIGARMFPDISNIGHEPATAPIVHLELTKRLVNGERIIGKPRTWVIRLPTGSESVESP